MSQRPPYDYLPLTGHAVVGAVKNHALDYSGASAAVAKVVVPDGYVYVGKKLVIQMVTASSVVLESFGDIAALTNGIEIGVYDPDDVLRFHMLDSGSLKSNIDIFEYFDDVAVMGFNSNPTAVDGIVGHIAVNHFLPEGNGLVLREGWYIGVTLDDNLAALTELEFMMTGYTSTHQLNGALIK